MKMELRNSTSERNSLVVRFGGTTRFAIAVVVGRLRRAQNPQRRHHNLSHGFRAALPILEFASLQPPFDKDYGASRHEFFRNLRQLIPRNAANPFHALVSVLFVAEWLIDRSEKFATDLPADVDSTSAFCPALPSTMTLFTPTLDCTFPPFHTGFRKVAMK